MTDRLERQLLALKVSCGRCGAAPGEPCRSSDGHARHAHAIRRLNAVGDRPRCTAVLITKLTPQLRNSLTGPIFCGSRHVERCTVPAVDRVDGHPVCWVHAQAARNPHRTIPLEYFPETIDATPRPELTP